MTIFLPLFNSLSSFSQNLVQNPDFESYIGCPDNIGLGTLNCTFWENGNGGTCDYFNACDVSGFVDVPTNLFGTQAAHSGDGYTGFYVHAQTTTYYEYLQVLLTDPLVTGSTYYVSFYVSLADKTCGTNRFGVYFSNGPPVYSGSNRIDVIPQVDYQQGFLTDANGWTKVSGCFTALGGESYMTIGNFHTYAETLVDPDCGLLMESYYYIDDVVVEKGPHPTTLPLDLGGPVTTCNSYLVLPNVDSVAYLWDDGSTADSLLVFASGNYSVSISDGCNSGEDSIDIIILHAPPPVDIGMDTATICLGDSVVISLDPVWNYAWSTGSNEPSISLFSQQTYAVTLSDQCGNSIDSIFVGVNLPPPNFSLGVDTNLCDQDVLDYTFDMSWGNFLWQDGSISNSFQIEGPGVYSLQVTNMCGSISDTITISEITSPVFDIPDSFSFCLGETFLVNLDTLNATFLWQDGNTNSQYFVSTEGHYFVQAMNSCGTTADTFDVTNVLPTSVDLGPDLSLCFLQLPYLLDASHAPEAMAYVWNDGSLGQDYNITNAGMVSVTVSNACFTDSDTILVSITNQSPVVNLPSDTLLCKGDTILLTYTGSSGQYQWQDFSGNSVFTVTKGGIYSLTVSNICGAGADTIVIMQNVEEPVLDLGVDISACFGDTVTITPLISNVAFIWQDGSTQPAFSTLVPMDVILTVNNLCGFDLDTISVYFLSAPSPFDLGADTLLCAGEQLILIAPNSPDNIEWQDGSHEKEMIADVAQVYVLNISNVCGNASDSIQLSYLTDTPFVNWELIQTICPDEIRTLDATQAFEAKYLWNTGAMESTIQIMQPGTYTVTITTECSSLVFETKLEEADTCVTPSSFYVPNVFSPNGDNVNDEFGIILNDKYPTADIHTEIFDRWGNLIYRSDEPDATWDGTFNGNAMNPGVYVYRIELSYQKEQKAQTILLHGNVTLVR